VLSRRMMARKKYKVQKPMRHARNTSRRSFSWPMKYRINSYIVIILVPPIRNKCSLYWIVYWTRSYPTNSKDVVYTRHFILLHIFVNKSFLY
uniref:G-protein alpha subunit n=1 Tax=Parascaris univalens TaxID=6257 RepID=A0A915CIW1_PARUN